MTHDYCAVNNKIEDGKSEITLNDFLEMWHDCDMPILVVDYADFDNGIAFGDEKNIKKFLQEYEALFSLASYQTYKPMAYLQERYAYAQVQAFTFIGAWCVIGINEYEPVKKDKVNE